MLKLENLINTGYVINIKEIGTYRAKLQIFSKYSKLTYLNIQINKLSKP